jgi:hypothetical protein
MSVLRLIIVDDQGEMAESSLRVEHLDLAADEYRVGMRARELYRDYLHRIGQWDEWLRQRAKALNRVENRGEGGLNLLEASGTDRGLASLS